MVNNKEKEKEKEIINKTKNSTDERKIRQKIINKNIVKIIKYLIIIKQMKIQKNKRKKN